MNSQEREAMEYELNADYDSLHERYAGEYVDPDDAWDWEYVLRSLLFNSDPNTGYVLQTDDYCDARDGKAHAYGCPRRAVDEPSF